MSKKSWRERPPHINERIESSNVFKMLLNEDMVGVENNEAVEPNMEAAKDEEPEKDL